MAGILSRAGLLAPKALMALPGKNPGKAFFASSGAKVIGKIEAIECFEHLCDKNGVVSLKTAGDYFSQNAVFQIGMESKLEGSRDIIQSLCSRAQSYQVEGGSKKVFKENTVELSRKVSFLPPLEAEEKEAKSFWQEKVTVEFDGDNKISLIKIMKGASSSLVFKV